MRRLVPIALIAALVAARPVAAQTGTITGHVVGAEDGRPVMSARVSVRGTSVAALTRADGAYTLAVAPGTYTVVARRLGYMPDSVTGVVVNAGGATSANFTLKTAASVLGEVTVTVPYTTGSQSGREQTGAVASVEPKEFNTGRIVSPEQLITGKVAGVQVIDNNEPGGGLAVRVRGGTSVNASNDPLYVVDGVPLVVGGGTSSGRSPLNFINPQDIENITVLKDASATAIYGSRGANGVVLITTKNGVTGPQFSYTGTYSSSHVTGGPDLLGAAQYRSAVQKYASSNVAVLGSANTDWLNAIEQTGSGMDHDLSMNGHREAATYHLGLDYVDQNGVLRGTRVQRVAGTLNYTDQLFNNRLGVQTHIKGAREKDFYTPGSVLGNAVAMAPTQPIYSAPGTYFQYLDPNTGKFVAQSPNNPIADLNQIQDQGSVFRTIGNLQLDYTVPFIDGLTATVRGDYDADQATRSAFTPTYAWSQVKAPSNAGNIYQNNPRQLNTVLDAYGRYARLLNGIQSSLDITGGYSYEAFRGDYPSMTALGLSTDLLGLNGFPTSNEVQSSYIIDESRLVSGFGRLNFTLRDRYLFTATVRRDGSSRFAPGRQWGTFPSAAFAWRAIDESFFRSHPTISDLKFRVSWGLNGNQSISSIAGSYPAYTSYTVGQSTAQAQFGNQFITTIRPSASDPNLQWEKTASTDVGVDYGFFGNRVSGSLDWYTKKTTNLLFTVPTAAGTALSNFITTNLGSVQNRGWELAVNTTPIDNGRSGLRWDANFVASTNSNELLSINRPGITTILSGGIAGGVGSLIQVEEPGYPINSFFVYQHKEVNGRPVADTSNAVKATDMYVDLNKDGVINQSDRRPFHSAAPKWILGHTSTVTWHDWDASTTLRAYLGNYVYNNVASNFGHYSLLSQQYAPTNLQASVLENGFNQPQYLSDLYVENASFLRMDNLSLGYTFERLLNLRGARVFGTIQNVFTTTKYSGVDPTAGLGGIDNNLYPRSRTYLAGLSVGF